MSSRAERERMIVIDSGSPLAGHSMNQRKIKLSLEGERCLGISQERKSSEFSQMLEDQESDELFAHFSDAAKRFEEDGLPLPERVGLFALGIGSLINAILKKDPGAFFEGTQGAVKSTYKLGSPLESLTPKTQMVANFFKRSGIPYRPEYVNMVSIGAEEYLRIISGH